MNLQDISRYNEVFLDDVVSIDYSKYCISIFFTCDKIRFKNISDAYEKKFGFGAHNYMLGAFQSWKSGSIHPNASTRDKIVAATMATFDLNEKFLFSYTTIISFIQRKFLKYSTVNSLPELFTEILRLIEKFDLRYSTSHGHRIFEIEEAKKHEILIKGIFTFYAKLIFSSIAKDLRLIQKLSQKLNSGFLKLSYRTYLYGVHVSVQTVDEKDILLLEKYDWGFTNSDQLINDLVIHGFNLEDLLELTKAHRKTMIDGELNMLLLEDLSKKVHLVASTGLGGDFKYNLRSNSGFVQLELRVLSHLEIALLSTRLALFVVASIVFLYLVFTKGGDFIVILGYLVLTFLLLGTKYEDLTTFIKDIYSKKNGRK